MINTKSNRADCCGCGACYVVCPVQAITLVSDERGFDHPFVNTQKCIQCDLCEKACIFKKRKMENQCEK